MKAISKVILKTLCYGDVFDYPLRAQEIAKLQISGSKPQTITKSQLLNCKLIGEKEGYYFLKGREQLIKVRKRRERCSRGKMEKARQVARWLKLIPTIKMLAVTGALARNNAKEEDDIDLMIVSSSGWLWTTRFLAILLVELVSKRRRPGERKAKDKICLNMFLDEEHLAVPREERDLFSAHEVAQLKVLWSRGEVYEKFLAANHWVREYLANFQILETKFQKNSKCKIQNKNKVLGLFENWKLEIENLIEGFLQSFQLWYMRSRRTNEVIKEGYLRFHPEDARKWVLPKYQQCLRKLGFTDVYA